MTDYDVLIVGSGAAGGMAAYTLTQRGAKCLMLEAGPSDTVRTFERRATYVFEELAHDLRFEMLARRPEMYPPGYSIHEIGTCRMGDDPRKSVLNRWNQRTTCRICSSSTARASSRAAIRIRR